MDISQVLSVLRLNWDLPWRVFASLFALSTAAGIGMGETALALLAKLSRWVGLDSSVAAILSGTHTWLVNHAVLPGMVGLLLELVGLFFAGDRNQQHFAGRAPASVLIGACLAIECGWVLPAACVVGAAALSWLVAVVVRIVYVARDRNRAWDDEVFVVEERLRRTWFSSLVAMFFIPFAPVAWAVRA